MKRLIMLLGLLTALSIGNSSVSAEVNNQNISEEELNEFLIEAGAPEDLLQRWEYEQKLDLYTKGQDSKIEFDTTQTSDFIKNDKTGELIESKNPSGSFSIMSTIPTSKLKVSHDIWTMTTGGVKYKTVFANYQWSTHKKGTKGDKIAIAIPSGWEVKAGSYRCKEFQSGVGPKNYSQTASCGGRAYDLDFYGAVWSLSGTADVWHKGWVNLDMKRTNSSAQKKVLSKYIENTGKSTSWSIGWGPMSVSISGNKSNNQVAWDTSFTY